MRILPMYSEIMIPFKKENNPPSRPPKPGPSQAQPSWGWESLFCSDFYSHRGRAGAEVLMTRGRPACAVVPCGWAPGPGTRVIRHCQQRGAPRPICAPPGRGLALPAGHRYHSGGHQAFPTLRGLRDAGRRVDAPPDGVTKQDHFYIKKLVCCFSVGGHLLSLLNECRPTKPKFKQPLWTNWLKFTKSSVGPN